MTTKVPAELSSTPSIVDNGNSTAVTIDSSELVGIGTTSPVTHLHLESSAATQFRIRTTSSSSEPQMIMIDGAGDYFAMQKVDRGMTFKPQGAEEVRIDADGLKFNGDTAAANALDDYEEGTWTPTDASGASLSFSTIDKNRYTKIGRFVMAHARIDYPSTSNTSTATVSLPVTPSTDCIASVTGGVVVEQNYSSDVTLTAAVDGTNGARFRINGVGALQNQNLSGKSVRFTVIYISA